MELSYFETIDAPPQPARLHLQDQVPGERRRLWRRRLGTGQAFYTVKCLVITKKPGFFIGGFRRLKNPNLGLDEDHRKSVSPSLAAFSENQRILRGPFGQVFGKTLLIGHRRALWFARTLLLMVYLGRKF